MAEASAQQKQAEARAVEEVSRARLEYENAQANLSKAEEALGLARETLRLTEISFSDENSKVVLKKEIFQAAPAHAGTFPMTMSMASAPAAPVRRGPPRSALHRLGKPLALFPLLA